jgi:hypothetical protein
MVRRLIASLLLWPFLAVAVGVCFDRLPSTEPLPHGFNQNWIGQRAAVARLNAFLLLVFIYGVKYLIELSAVRWVRVYYFTMLVVASLPCIWLLVVIDWWNEHVFPIACWVYYPVGLWFIPAASFALDTVRMDSSSLRWYTVRSCVELLLMLPWMYFWVFFSFLFLGGGWI